MVLQHTDSSVNNAPTPERKNKKGKRKAREERGRKGEEFGKERGVPSLFILQLSLFILL